MKSVTFWLTLMAIGIAVLLAAHLFGCAAGAPIQCPFGTYARRATSSQGNEGGGHAGVSVPTASGSGDASWKGSGQSQWECLPLCPKGTAIDMSENGPGQRKLRCVDMYDCPKVAVKIDGGPR